MDSSGLIFIPDISGFTKFVSNVELRHSQHIIQELLEIIIDANQMELNVSEIEGDAILFYKLGESPNLSITFRQVEQMFLAFHQHLDLYESRRTCQCNACTSAIHLSLKIITHYGEFTEYRIKNFLALIGKDIIIAHQLLKNDIDQHEYWLITNNLTGGKAPEEFEPWIKWNQGSKHVNADEIVFHFAHLGHLKSSNNKLIK